MDKDTPSTMACRLCPENGEQPISNFYFFVETRARRDGYVRRARYDSRCKKCTAAYKKGLAKKSLEAAKARRALSREEREAERAARDDAFREDVKFLLECRTPIEEIAQRLGCKNVDDLYARARALDVKMPERLRGTRAHAIDPYAPMNRPEAEEFCKRATAWLYRRYAERRYTTDLVAEISGAPMGSGLVRKAARRLGMTVGEDYRPAA